MPGRTLRFWLVFVLFLAAGTAHAKNPFDAAFSRLSRVDRFALGGVGIAGVTSQGEQDYRILLSSRAALVYFEKLYASGNLQARCYALLAIRRLAPTRFNELVSSVKNPEAQVTTQEGCIVSQQPFRELVDRIKAGEYDRIQIRP